MLLQTDMRKPLPDKNTGIKLIILVLTVSVVILFTLIGVSLHRIHQISDSSLTTQEKTFLAGYDALIRGQVQGAVSMVAAIEARSAHGHITVDVAKTEAAELLRKLRYGKEGYFWADTIDGTNIVMSNRDVEGKSRINLQDKNGKYFIREIISQGRKDHGGYTDYWFPKPGSDIPLPKRGYSLEFKPWGWVIGTGNYVDDIEKGISEHKSIIHHEFADIEKYYAISSLLLLMFYIGAGFRIISVMKSKNREIKSHEDELRKLSRAVQQSPVTTVITDTHGLIEFVNPKFTEITGYTAEEAIGQSIRILNAKQTPSETFADLWATISSGKIWKGELLNKTKEGSLFWEMATISPLYDENGVITHYIAIKEDITEKKKIIEQLEVAKVEADTANVAKSAFLATMSHEIRTPMNGVVSMSNLLLETNLNTEQRDYAEIISRSGENLLILIDEILDFSKIEAGKLELESAYFDMHLLLNDINRLLSYKAEESGSVLTCNIEPDVPTILKGDPGRVRQIITNLAGNALKFSEHGTITVNASVSTNQDSFVIIKFAISDTGIGIPESRLSAIFAPFTQVDASTTRKYGGTGLGLTICKQLSELMGGEIGVTSEEGKGSTFWFTAHLEKKSVEQGIEDLEVSQNAARTHVVTPGDIESLSGNTARILLVEDNLINQKVALHMLKSLGYTADVVEDGQQAVDALTKVNYDLVLMDCMMPNMNGFEASSIVRTESSAVLNHNVPIIAMTANAMKEDREKCLASGMDDYVSKPVKKHVLAAVLEKWLSPSTN